MFMEVSVNAINILQDPFTYFPSFLPGSEVTVFNTLLRFAYQLMHLIISLYHSERVLLKARYMSLKFNTRQDMTSMTNKNCNSFRLIANGGQC